MAKAAEEGEPASQRKFAAFVRICQQDLLLVAGVISCVDFDEPG